MKTILLKNYLLLNTEENIKLLKIRNTKEVTKASINQKMITFDEHLSWLNNLKEENDKEYFAVIYKDIIVGGINIFDLNKNKKWGVFFSKQTPLIIKSIVPIYFIDYIFDKFSHNELFAKIRKNNLNAISYNNNLGFKTIENKEIVTMQLKYELYLKAKSTMILKNIIKKMALYSLKIER